MIRFSIDHRPSKWGATAAVVRGQTVEAVRDHLAEGAGLPFDGLIRLSEPTEIKGYRYCLVEVSLDFNHPAFPAIAETLEEWGGTEIQVILVQTPEGDLYLIVDKANLPEEEARPDHPLLQQVAVWLGKALARSAR